MAEVPFIGKIVLMTVATIFAAGSAGIVLLCRTRPQRVTGRKEFFFESLYSVGGWVNSKLGIGGHRERDRIEKLQELVPFPEAQQIARNADEAPATYVVLFLPILLCVFAISGNPFFPVLGTGALVFLAFYFDWHLDQVLKKRHQEILRDYPAMLMDLSLMIHAGITANAAFERVAGSSDGVLYREMAKCSANIRDGMSIDAALNGLLTHCPVREIRKFVSLYRQNLSKGGPDFPKALDEMAENAWRERKNNAKEQGELAEQKLLIPTICMFIGILMMVIVPAFRSLLS